MRSLFTIVIVVSLSVGACNSGTKSFDDFKIAGAYVRADTVEINHLETGQRIGSREIRDTIYIDSADKGYQVANHRWRLNHFDSSGWVNMAHDGNRPLPSYEATYHKQMKILMPRNELVGRQLIIDPALKTISIRGVKYVKAE